MLAISGVAIVLWVMVVGFVLGMAIEVATKLGARKR